MKMIIKLDALGKQDEEKSFIHTKPNGEKSAPQEINLTDTIKDNNDSKR
jgi:hypothetical protein